MAKLDGKDRALQRLTQMPARARREGDKLADSLASQAVTDAKRFAPFKTGRLRRSIKKRKGEVVADAPHAHLVEFGTKNAPAQPFLRPAFRLARRRAGRKGKAALKAMIKGTSS